MHKILVVEDESALRKILKDDLELEGYQVLIAHDGEEGLRMALESKPDLVLLDVMMPKLSGWDVCRQLKAKQPALPIIMLTAKGQETDKVTGFDLGVDDYVTKPFSVMELVGRVKAVLRRSKPSKVSLTHVAFGDVTVNFEKFEAKKGVKLFKLSAREFKILKVLMEHQGKVVSREEILNEAWGYVQMPESRTVDTHILALRRKLEGPSKKGEYIVTVHGAGYKFVGSYK